MDNRIFVDMDGTLAEYNPEATAEDYQREGYFTKLAPNYSMLNAIKILIGLGYDIYILSAVYMETSAVSEKTAWLLQYLPELWDSYSNPKEHLVFVPVGANKLDYINNPGRTDILIDDYSKNLIPWSNTGIGIKCVNGINWRVGTWFGYEVDLRSDAAYIANTIRGIIAVESGKVA